MSIEIIKDTNTLEDMALRYNTGNPITCANIETDKHNKIIKITIPNDLPQSYTCLYDATLIHYQLYSVDINKGTLEFIDTMPCEMVIPTLGMLKDLSTLFHDPLTIGDFDYPRVGMVVDVASTSTFQFLLKGESCHA